MVERFLTWHCFAEGGGQSISEPAAGNHGEGQALEVLKAEVPTPSAMNPCITCRLFSLQPYGDHLNWSLAIGYFFDRTF